MKGVVFVLFFLFSVLNAQECKYSKLLYNGTCEYLFRIKRDRMENVELLLDDGAGLKDRIARNGEEFVTLLNEINNEENPSRKEIKLKYAKEIVIETFVAGGYKESIGFIQKLDKVTCGCEIDDHIDVLKQQLKTFYTILGKIGRGLETENCSMIADNMKSMASLAKEISSTDTFMLTKQNYLRADSLSCSMDKYDKKKQYIKAHKAAIDCIEIQPEHKACHTWLNNRQALCKKLLSKAKVFMSSDVEKTKKTLKTIMTLLTSDFGLYKEAEQLMKKLP